RRRPPAARRHGGYHRGQARRRGDPDARRNQPLARPVARPRSASAPDRRQRAAALRRDRRAALPARAGLRRDDRARPIERGGRVRLEPAARVRHGRARHAGGARRLLARCPRRPPCRLHVHGRITYWSPLAEKACGWEAKELLGHHVSEFYKGGMDEARALMRRLRVETRVAGYRTTFRKKSGGWAEIDTSVALVRDARGAV